MASARDRLALARTAFDAGFSAGAVSAAYYAMLYAARAALSEEGAYAKTHKGVWQLFSARFVRSDRVDSAVFASTQRAQELRLLGDYEAGDVSTSDAEAIVASAQLFVRAVTELLGGS
jgi:uncharacterized protein (UPF0332 family)